MRRSEQRQPGSDTRANPVDPPRPLATFYTQAEPGPTYWRCVLPARHLPGAVRAGLPEIAAAAGRMEFPDHQGAAVFQVPGDAARAVVIAHMRELGIRVLVETDDNYVTFERAHDRVGWAARIADESERSIERHMSIVAEWTG